MRPRRPLHLILLIAAAVTPLLLVYFALRWVQSSSVFWDNAAPLQQSRAPRVAWKSEFEPGLVGGVAVDQAGDVYLWYRLGAYVIKHDRRGKVVWSRRFVPRDQNGWCCVTQGPNGDLFILYETTRNQVILSKLLPNGTPAGKTVVQGGIIWNSGCFAVDGRGGFVAIERRPSGTGSNILLTRFTKAGKAAWSARLQTLARGFGFGYRPEPKDLAFGPDGTICLIIGDDSLLQPGTWQGAKWDWQMLRFAPDGKRLWKAPAPTPTSTLRAMRLGPEGRIYTAGQYEDQGYYIAGFRPGGRRAWLARSRTKTDDYVAELTLDPAGNVYVAGETYKQSAWPVGFVAKHDPGGRLLWRKQVPDLAMLWGLTVDGGGAVYLSGMSRPLSHSLIKLE